MDSLKNLFSCLIVSVVFLFFSVHGFSQKVDTVSTFSLTAYLDAYYAYYTDSVGSGNFQKFPSVSPRSNSPSLNIAQIAMQYNADKVRATAVLHFGDIPASVWAAEPYNHIMEAHVGFKVYSKLWIDAGFFRTHFGTEFLLPSENITSSVAVPSFYEPYYESGIRLNFDPTKKLEINVFLLNGYGVFVDNNNTKSLGMGVTYAFNDNAGIGYTNYIGDESPPGDLVKHLRIHQNVFFNYQHNKIKLQAGADYCLQQNSDIATGTETATMYSGLLTVKYQVKSKFGVYARGEMFQDPEGWMSGVIKDATGKMTGLKCWGITAGMEYKPTDESYVKLEGRLLQMDKDQYIFMTDGNPQNARFEIMINAGVTFDLIKSLKTRITGGGQ
jgi:hypothetical protein